MATVQKSLRIPEDILRAIEEMAQASHRDFSSVANQMLAEAIKMRRCPGIIFTEGVSGCRARIAGTGLEVWEVVSSYNSLDRDFERLHCAYHWLSDVQLRAGLGYYAAYPEEVEEQIARNEAWTPERLLEQHPILALNRR